MLQESSKSNKGGFTALEALVASAVTLVVIASVTAAMNVYLRAHSEALKATKAAFLAEEGMEAVRSLRDAGWTSNVAAVPAGQERHFSFDGSAWSLSATPTLIDSVYHRTVRLDSAYRNASGKLASSGTLEPNVRKATVTVSWQNRGATTTRALTAYVANIFDN